MHAQGPQSLSSRWRLFAPNGAESLVGIGRNAASAKRSLPSANGCERSCQTLNVPSTTVLFPEKVDEGGHPGPSTSKVGATVVATCEYARIVGT